MKRLKRPTKLKQLKKVSSFSPRQLTVYVLIFGILGASAYLGFAAGRPTLLPNGKSVPSGSSPQVTTTGGTTAPSNASPSQKPSSTTAPGSQKDNTPPSLSITAPAGGATVNGKVQIGVSANDNSKVTKSELYIDGNFIALNTASPFGYAWDSSSVSNGAHSITIEVSDPSGNINGRTIYVSVFNNSDTSGPQISILAPQNGSTVSGDITIRASASDTSGVASITISVDGNAVATCTNSSSCAYIWSTSGIGSGSHTIQVKATDSSSAANTTFKTIQVTK